MTEGLLGPPVDSLGSPVGLVVELHRGSTTYAALRDITLHESGVEMTLDLRLDEATGGYLLDLCKGRAGPSLSFDYFDGRVSMTAGESALDTTAHAVLVEVAGHGGRYRSMRTLWLRPRPTSDGASVTFRWPAVEVSVEVRLPLAFVIPELEERRAW